MDSLPDLKDAVLELFNSIDSDLDSIAYDEDTKSDRTIEAIKQLDIVLVGEPEEDEVEPNAVIKNDSLLDDEVDYAAEPTEGT